MRPQRVGSSRYKRNESTERIQMRDGSRENEKRISNWKEKEMEMSL